MMHWNYLKFVDNEGARTPEKVVLRNPQTKTIMLKYSDMWATFSRDQYISSMHILKHNNLVLFVIYLMYW